MQKITLTKIVKVGNGLYTRIPIAYLRALNIDRGDYIIAEVYSDDCIVLRKVTDDELSELKPKDIQYGL